MRLPLPFCGRRRGTWLAQVREVPSSELTASRLVHSPNKLIVDDRSTDDSSGESSEPLPVARVAHRQDRLRVPRTVQELPA